MGGVKCSGWDLYWPRGGQLVSLWHLSIAACTAEGKDGRIICLCLHSSANLYWVLIMCQILGWALTCDLTRHWVWGLGSKGWHSLENWETCQTGGTVQTRKPWRNPALDIVMHKYSFFWEFEFDLWPWHSDTKRTCRRTSETLLTRACHFWVLRSYRDSQEWQEKKLRRVASTGSSSYQWLEFTDLLEDPK